MILLRLWWEFFKIGLFSVGGGMATLPFLYDIADRTAWFTYDQIADMLAVSESTPGPIGINMATYTGFTTAGIPGSIAATLGIITPGIIIVLLIVAVLDRFRRNRYVEAAFYGLRPASTGLIAAAGVLVVGISLLNVDVFGQFRVCFQHQGYYTCGPAAVFYAMVQADEEAAPYSIHRRLGGGWNTCILIQYRSAEQSQRGCRERYQKPSDHISGGFYIST